MDIGGDEEQTGQQSNESQQSQPEIEPLAIDGRGSFALESLPAAEQFQFGADCEMRRR